MKKASHADQVKTWEQIPNIGKAMARDFQRLGLLQPAELALQEPLDLYQRLCAITGQRQDPCVLDTYLAAVDFMCGAQAQPWWAYTAQRKKRYPEI